MRQWGEKGYVGHWNQKQWPCEWNDPIDVNENMWHRLHFCPSWERDPSPAALLRVSTYSPPRVNSFLCSFLMLRVKDRGGRTLVIPMRHILICAYGLYRQKKFDWLNTSLICLHDILTWVLKNKKITHDLYRYLSWKKILGPGQMAMLWIYHCCTIYIFCYIFLLVKGIHVNHAHLRLPPPWVWHK